MATTYGTKNEVLMYPDNYQAFAQSFETTDATAVTQNGKKIIKAGTIWPANGAAARGIVFNDVDVTNGTATGAVIFEGSVLIPRLPAVPTSAAKNALHKITFFADLTPAGGSEPSE
ncbi:MAG: hypothetical protein LBM65_07575 [Oscillospiraceae bacterium]|jgi:hypothetical protein|nr:hypothetical protein [Oscillospiraceae bacterium]